MLAAFGLLALAASQSRRFARPAARRIVKEWRMFSLHLARQVAYPDLRSVPVRASLLGPAKGLVGMKAAVDLRLLCHHNRANG